MGCLIQEKDLVMTMIAAAHIVYDNTKRAPTLQELLTHLKSELPYEVSLTEWKGFTTVIPQVLIAMPSPITIQIDDDPEYVPAEIEELSQQASEVFDSEAVEAIRRCQSRLDIMSTTPTRVEEDSEALHVYAQTDLDPEAYGVTQVLFSLANFVSGYVYDCVNGRWLR